MQEPAPSGAGSAFGLASASSRQARVHSQPDCPARRRPKEPAPWALRSAWPSRLRAGADHGATSLALEGVLSRRGPRSGGATPLGELERCRSGAPPGGTVSAGGVLQERASSKRSVRGRLFFRSLSAPSSSGRRCRRPRTPTRRELWGARIRLTRHEKSRRLPGRALDQLVVHRRRPAARASRTAPTSIREGASQHAMTERLPSTRLWSGGS